MWTFCVRTGDLSHDGACIGRGYSGHLAGFRNPDLQSVHNVGPIPIGGWTILGPPYDTQTHGPYVMRLAPDPDVELYSRSGFLIHGDVVGHDPSSDEPGPGSEGCIVMDRPTRVAIWESNDRRLQVVAELPEDAITPVTVVEPVA